VATLFKAHDPGPRPNPQSPVPNPEPGLDENETALLASLDLQHGLMTWLGVGNVPGVLMRATAKKGCVQEMLLLRAGVVGSQLPSLQAAVLPISRGDILFFATDGIRGSFVESLSGRENPQRAANRILENYRTGNDDALVLVVRPAGSPA
jgi:Stage II sporulation protein E (SpoIIE)